MTNSDVSILGYGSSSESYTLTRKERQLLKSTLMGIIIGLIQKYPIEKEIRPVLQFTVSCNNRVVLLELGQLLLFALMEASAKVISMYNY